MPRHHPRQPLSRGFTLPELLVGVFLMGVGTLVLARILLSLVSMTGYTLRQTAALAAANKAMMNSGRLEGLVWATRESESLRGLSPAMLETRSPGSVDVDYYVSSGALVQRDTGRVSVQAKGPTELSIRYFEIGADGLIFESTATANASMAFFTVTLKGDGKKRRDYALLSAAALRNR